ncbi:hypothetical protein BDN72DRAFT_902251 [Pluteus cervinus]|uniref:Uncharacterized protein n=1 Tax=Pluteus cervinus TaxID=181527 RepID=A0ACD3AEA1_9AGAR|nr:hypothetical protein BDN72DRAFT_902251 [Pluteus cervinus]
MTHQLIHEVLPPEVLSLAFSLLDPLEPSNQGIPITLSLVCKGWRSVVLDTSYLWTCIRIQGKECLITKDTVAAVHSWFKKARDRPCHLFLGFPLRLAVKLDQGVLETIVFDLVQPVAARLGALVLCVPAKYLRSLAKLSPFHFPRLQTFAIRFPIDDSTRLSDFLSISTNAFSQSGTLRELELQHPTTLGILEKPAGVGHGNQSNLTKFQYTKLTSLTLLDSRLPLSSCVNIFHLATNLRHCEFLIYTPTNNGIIASAIQATAGPGVPGTSGNDLRPRRRYTHPNLQSLKLEGSSGPITPFFQLLSTDLPKLEDLRIGASSGATLWEWETLIPALTDYQKRHPFGLGEPHIFTQKMTQTDFLHATETERGLGRFEVKNIRLGSLERMNSLVDFLRINEGIETLLLEACALFKDEFLQQLIVPQLLTLAERLNDSRILLPNLKNLYIKDAQDAYHVRWPGGELVLSLLQSRWDIGPTNRLEGVSTPDVTGVKVNGVRDSEGRPTYTKPTTTSKLARLRKVTIPEDYIRDPISVLERIPDLVRLKEEGLILSLPVLDEIGPQWEGEKEERQKCTRSWNEKVDWIDAD